MMRRYAAPRQFANLLRGLASSASQTEGIIAAYTARVADGHLEDNPVQKKMVEFLDGALQQAVVFSGEEPTPWAWPVQTLGLGQVGSVKEDHRRVAQYTAQLAAANAQKVREQSRALKGQKATPSPQKASLPAPDEGGHTEARQAGKVAPESGSPEQPAKKPRPRRNGVYMHGPVGTGKTMLLDLFHSHAAQAGLKVKRRHFYEFMMSLHQQIHELDDERPVEVAANRLADSVDVLCFDEFQITDIQDVVILPRLFEVLFLRGVAVVMTSNTSPQLLYSGGLNRHVYLPAFISLLADHCTILGLGGPSGKQAIDYRLRAEAAEDAEHAEENVALYFAGPGAEDALQRRWLAQAAGSAKAGELALPMGRSLQLPAMTADACLVSFQELCHKDRGEADFLAIAESFSTVFLREVPSFTCLENVDEVKRFVKLLDVLYDRRIRLVLAAAGKPGELFEGLRAEVTKSDAGDLAWRTALYSSDGKAGMAPGAVGTLCEAVRATERAESRLREMRTQKYWQSCHRREVE